MMFLLIHQTFVVCLIFFLLSEIICVNDPIKVPHPILPWRFHVCSLLNRTIVQFECIYIFLEILSIHTRVKKFKTEQWFQSIILGRFDLLMPDLLWLARIKLFLTIVNINSYQFYHFFYWLVEMLSNNRLAEWVELNILWYSSENFNLKTNFMIEIIYCNFKSISK